MPRKSFFSSKQVERGCRKTIRVGNFLILKFLIIMKKLLLKSFVLIGTFFVSFFETNAQQIQTTNPPAVYSSVVGGARILATQGNTAANPAIGFSGVLGQYPKNNLNDGGGGNGIFRPAANTMAFSTSSLERMRISSGGELGINTTNPTALLHVKCTNNGGVRFESMQNGSGSVLVIDSNGNVKKACAAIACGDEIDPIDIIDLKKQVEALKKQVAALEKK
jgi:hypothetical protein